MEAVGGLGARSSGRQRQVQGTVTANGQPASKTEKGPNKRCKGRILASAVGQIILFAETCSFALDNRRFTKIDYDQGEKVGDLEARYLLEGNLDPYGDTMLNEVCSNNCTSQEPRSVI